MLLSIRFYLLEDLKKHLLSVHKQLQTYNKTMPSFSKNISWSVKQVNKNTARYYYDIKLYLSSLVFLAIIIKKKTNGKLKYCGALAPKNMHAKSETLDKFIKKFFMHWSSPTFFFLCSLCLLMPKPKCLIMLPFLTCLH